MYSIVHYNVQYCTLFIVLTALYSIAQDCAVLTVFYSIVQYCTVLQGIARYCTVLRSIAQDCKVLDNIMSRHFLSIY